MAGRQETETWTCRVRLKYFFREVMKGKREREKETERQRERERGEEREREMGRCTQPQEESSKNV